MDQANSQLAEGSQVVCIYHGGNCLDGFTSAWLVRMFYMNSNVQFTTIPALYTDAPLLAKLHGAIVYIVDFGYTAENMRAIAAVAKSVVIIDHHKSTIDALTNEPLGSNVKKVFDLAHSGAVLTFEYLFDNNTTDMPVFVAYVEDRDLWHKVLPNSEEVSAALFARDLTFAEWDNLLDMPIETLAADGTSLLRVRKKNVNDMVKRAWVSGVICGYNVPIINVPWFFGSDACHLLLELNPDVPFAAYYWDSQGKRNWGLRSSDSRTDVSLIAKQLGGGGHRNASGFVTDLPIIQVFATDSAILSTQAV